MERGNKWPYLDTLVKLVEACKVEVYELLKPENTLPPATTDILVKFTEDSIAVLEKTLETAGKQASRLLIAIKRSSCPKRLWASASPTWVSKNPKK